MNPDKQRITIAEGVKFGRLTALRYSHHTNSRMAVWWFICDCGVKKRILASSVRNGHTASCGCLRRETSTKSKTIHGNASRGNHSAEYRCWSGMLSRCNNPYNSAFNDYGGRGITVCPRWLVFNDFLCDMGRKPSTAHSIERRDNDLGYSKNNCYWATAKQQANNRRNRRWKKKPLTAQ